MIIQRLLNFFPNIEPVGEYTKELIKFDPEYFEFGPEESPDDPTVYLNRINTENQIGITLATWCFDHSFDLDESSWQMLDKIELFFGLDVRQAVLYNMFHRRHDT